MTDTKELLKKIAALRVRLDQAQGLMRDTERAAVRQADPDSPPPGGPPSTLPLGEEVRAGAVHQDLLDNTLRPLAETKRPAAAPAPRLTAPALRLVQEGRELLKDLRDLAGDALLSARPDDPFALLTRDTSAMLDAVLRIVPAFPESPSGQVRMCEGLEVVLATIRDRLQTQRIALDHKRLELARLQSLAGMLRSLAGGKAIELGALIALAETILAEAQHNLPLHFFQVGPDECASFVAGHSLNTAQVLARLLIGEADWQSQAANAVAAALVHDVAMVRLPAQILAQTGPLDDEQRRRMERHTSVGAQLVDKALPGVSLAIEAAADHHERVDGTGYPSGKKAMQLSTFAKLLAVVDVYAAFCASRPYRPALDTRTALTDTLLLADQGALDKDQAEKLLKLSFYPAGSVVEFEGGAVGMVLASQPGPKAMLHPARPIVALLVENGGQPLAMPRVLDLLLEESRTILRALPSEDRQRLLGVRYPALV